MPHPSTQQAFTYTLVSFLLMTAVFAVLQFGFTHWDVWNNFEITREGIQFYFCEHAYMDEIFRERVNTWSNLAFFFSGAWVVALGVFDWRSDSKPVNLIQQHPMYSMMFGFVMIYLFLGSALFHASLTPFPQQWDMSGVFALITAPMVYNLHKVYNFHKFGSTGAFSAKETKVSITTFVLIFMVLTSFKWQLDEFVVVPIFLVLNGLMIGYLEKKTPIKTKYLWWSIVFIALAMVSFFLDLRKIGCEPKSLFQFHSLWHIGNGMAALLLYFYFRSEKVSNIKT